MNRRNFVQQTVVANMQKQSKRKMAERFSVDNIKRAIQKIYDTL